MRRLAHRLRKADVETWLDESELRIGDSLLLRLSEAIASVDFVAAVLSRNSIASRWVETELRQAMVREIHSNRVVVLPILLDDVDIPAFLADKLYADFREPHRFDESFVRLLRTIGKDVIFLPAPKRFIRDDLEFNAGGVHSCGFTAWILGRSFR